MTHQPYTWPAKQPAPVYKRKFLDEAVYGQSIEALIIKCADVMPYLRSPDRLLLAVRNNKPMNGPWHFGGRVLPGETEMQAAQRHFKRDAGTFLSPERMTLIPETDVNRNYLWHDRQQQPQNTPCHTYAHTYAVEPTATEIETIADKITYPEYVPGSLFAADWQRLQQPDIHPVLRDIYVSIFGRPQQGRWNKPAVADITGQTAVTEQSLARARRVIAEFSQEPLAKRLELMRHPNRAYLSTIVESYYTDRVVHDFYRDNCPSGERILREKKPGWQKSAEEFYAIYAGRKTLTRSGR